MANYESDQIEFAILSLVRDPLMNLIPSLAQNVKVLNFTLPRLRGMSETFELDTLNCTTGPEPRYRLTYDLIESQNIPKADNNILVGGTQTELRGLYEKLISVQNDLQAKIEEELELIRIEDERTARRRHDNGPLIQKWIRFLAHHEAVKPIAEAL